MLIGDVQGCHTALIQLAGSATPICLGDVVNRGPESLATLYWLREKDAQTLLGNHDFYLMVCAMGAAQPTPDDTIHDILAAPDCAQFIEWLRYRPLALMHENALLVHAGVIPQWTAQDTLERAAEVEAVLQGPHWQDFLRNLWGNVPLQWRDDLQGYDRLRCIVNILTRIRYCTPEGRLDLTTKESTGGAPAGYLPWFDVPGRKTQDITVVFGHWSTMGLINRPNLIGLDTGYVWGGALTGVDLHSDWTKRRFVHVPCNIAQKHNSK
jgi:bis(5'-nucleosyl)-tetraphosphatase (symmetrical)